MKRSLSYKILKLFMVLVFTGFQANVLFATQIKKFEVGENTFLLNDKPFIIKAAELHYPRIPKEYWDHRVKMTKALGMNTVCLYTFWNIHEPSEGKFDFTGQNDLREFIKICESNGMKVILRPGPYVCAEWEMGGLPWWLLKKKDISLRENDPYFLEKVEAFQKAVAEQVGDLTIENGGPIIMVQVENEYGAYGEDKEYINNIKKILKKYFGEEILMFQCDWASNFILNGLDDLLWTMNFGTGADIDAQFAELKQLRPESPLMCSEFWSGWFDKWGANHETRPADDMIAGIDEMLQKNISFSLYMTHGGTNWGHWAGANSPGFSPDVTSYDYDAPINEYGWPTEKFWKLRTVLEKYKEDGTTLPEVPELVKPTYIKPFKMTELAPLWDNLPEAIRSDSILTFEEMDMGFGSACYSTTLPALEGKYTLIVEEPHDFAQIFLNGKFVGSLDRRKDEKELLVDLDGNSKLDILVEGMGRINFGRAIKDYKGITKRVLLKNNKTGETIELKNWLISSFPDKIEFYNSMVSNPVDQYVKGSNGRFAPGIYRGEFSVDTISDTFLNMENWGKGLVYVNGKALGRFWEIGPQQTLYLPGPWINEGKNEILIFDILGPKNLTIEGMETPVLNKLNILEENYKSGDKSCIDLKKYQPAACGTFKNGPGWKTLKLEQPITGKYLCFEVISTHSDSDVCSIAEFYVLDEHGRRISRESWKGISDSEETTGNHGVDKIFDLQESTYWCPEDKNELSHYILLDLGKIENISGIEYLPRAESGTPGAVKDFIIYIAEEEMQ